MRDQDGVMVKIDRIRAAGGRIALEEGVLGVGSEGGRGSSSTSNSGRSRMNPRASASFCHWPNGASTPFRRVARAAYRDLHQTIDDVRRAGAVNRDSDSRLVVEARHVTQPDGLSHEEFEADEVLKRAGQPRAPGVGRHACEWHVIHQDGSGRGLVHLGEQLDERGLAGTVFADDRDHGVRRQREGDVVQHEPRGTGIGKRHAIEADALPQAGWCLEVG